MHVGICPDDQMGFDLVTFGGTFGQQLNQTGTQGGPGLGTQLHQLVPEGHVEDRELADLDQPSSSSAVTSRIMSPMATPQWPSTSAVENTP